MKLQIFALFVIAIFTSCVLAAGPHVAIAERGDAPAAPATPVISPTSPGVPCGCYNDCTLFGCGYGIPKEKCFCTLECDAKYACPPAPPKFKCGCTNDCKIACSTCICPQFCDPRYVCPPTMR